jgi:hypothetical protein
VHGPTGINVFSVSDATGTGIIANKIRGESIDSAANKEANVEVHLNDLPGKSVGIENSSSGTSDAVENWLGCFGGSGAKGCLTVNTLGNGTAPSIPLATKPSNRTVALFAASMFRPSLRVSSRRQSEHNR